VLVVLEVQPQVCMLIFTLPVGNHLYKPGIYISIKNFPPIPVLSVGNNLYAQFHVKKCKKEILETVELIKREKELESN